MAVATFALFAFAATSQGADAPAKVKIKVLLVRNGGHDGKGFSAFLTPILEKTGDYEVTPTDNRDDLKAESIKKYDLVLFYGSGGDFTDPAQEQGLIEFARNGGGVAGVHATDACKKSDLYWELLGGRFAGHGSAKYTGYICDAEHPITAGMKDFEVACASSATWTSLIELSGYTAGEPESSEPG